MNRKITRTLSYLCHLIGSLTTSLYANEARLPRASLISLCLCKPPILHLRAYSVHSHHTEQATIVMVNDILVPANRKIQWQIDQNDCMTLILLSAMLRSFHQFPIAYSVLLGLCHQLIVKTHQSAATGMISYELMSCNSP